LATCALAILVLPGAAEARSSGGGASLGDITLRVAAMPTGAITLSPAGKDPQTDETIDTCSYDYPGGECLVVYSVGPSPLTVTLTPDPGVGQDFYAWSTADCGAEPTCEVVLKDSERPPQVLALFTPAELSVLIAGSGTVTTSDGSINCLDPQVLDPASDCQELLPAGSTLTLEAKPAEQGEAVTWVFGCDPGDDENASTCVARPENRFVGVRFGDAPGPAPPFDVDVTFRVTTTGPGTVAIGSTACPSSCDTTVHFGARLHLSAVETSGSRFKHWVGGPCSTQPNCTLNAGPVTAIRAVFEPRPAGPAQPPSAPALPPPPPSVSPEGPRAPQPVAEAPSHPGPRAVKLTARVLDTAVRRVGGRYRVVARIDVSKQATGLLRVARGRRVLGARTVVLPKGRTKAWVALAPAIRSGTSWLLLRIRDSDDHVLTFRRSVVLGR
jgi:hypothetical protein